MIDDFDRKILQCLQEDGRLTNNDLAERVGLSASQCSRRRTSLEEVGIITGYTAHVDAEKIGIDLISMVSITLANHDEKNAEDLRKLLTQLPNVMDAFALTGEMDYSLKIVSRDLKDLSAFINDVLLPHPAVQNVKSAIVLDTIKHSSNLPL